MRAHGHGRSRRRAEQALDIEPALPEIPDPEKVEGLEQFSYPTARHRIREHALQKVPFLLVVGDKEAEAGKVNVRTRGKEKTEDMAAPEFVEKIRKLIAEKSPGL